MNMFLRWIVIIVLIIITSHFAFSQQLMRDNLGSHIATKNLSLAGFSITAANAITATGTVNAGTVISPVVLAGTATAVSNSSIALQVDGTNKAILVPRVTDLLNATTPSIPVANAVNGMIVYDVATAKFYYRQNNTWVVYVDAVNYVDRYVPQVILGLKTMKSDSGFVATGTYVGPTTTVPTPILGAGARMMWYPAKSAFRAGTATGAEWNAASTGVYSTALNFNTTASGSSSTALGLSTIASGANSFASGLGSTASGLDSFTYGNGTVASSSESFAGGWITAASGPRSVALGNNSFASGLQSMAFGTSVTASGDYSYAIGTNLNTNAGSGTFMLGDGAGTMFSPSGANEINMRFSGGFRLFSNTSVTTGVFLGPGASSWGVISDKRKKENLEIIDAESFLLKIDTMQVGSWNYKVQDPKTFRHYGPMAQDFFGAFGKDSYGTIGCDTLIASADFDGVNMIAIKGLISRTNQLQKENDSLKIRLSALEAKNTAEISALSDKNEKLTEMLLKQESDSVKMQATLAKLERLMEK